jgi:arylsulfatase A-like enzyme
MPAESCPSRYTAVLPGLPDIPAFRSDVADFHASLRALDRSVGAVLDALDASGLANRTIVILTTDHGPALPGMKSTLTDAGLGVGLIVRIPGITTPGSVSDALVSQIDLYPTICDFLGTPAPDWLQGVSLLPILVGSRIEVRTETFGEVTFHAAYEPQRSVRSNRWLYIRRFGRRSLPVLPNVDASPALDGLVQHDWQLRPQPEIQLYDNAADPLQRVNLAGVSELRSVEEDLIERLDAWMKSTNDPLLAGPVPLPPGGVVNRASDANPDGELVSTDFE